VSLRTRPFAAGEAIEIRTAERRSFCIQRTLEIRREGVPVVYVTETEQPDLPPPVHLAIGDVSCAWDLPGVIVTHHQLVARDDAGAAAVIDVGHQGRVGPFRIHNDVIRKYPPGIDDAVDVFRVAVVRD
jgi:hypothetical protein